MPDLTQARRGPHLTASALVQSLPPATRYILRGDAAVRAAAEQALSLQLPASACRAAPDGERAALWLGPDEWLLIAPEAATLLAAGCPLDLDARAFPVNMCTRTVLGKAEVVLWRTGTQQFRIEVWRSFAAYVCAFLAEATLGIG